MENSTITFITDQLKALTSIPSPSGFTKEVAQYLVSTLEEMGFTPERSRKGNVCVTIGGEGSPLILAAHVDTLGAMVRSIKSNGRLRPTTLGGHQWCTADGENCTVHTRDGKVHRCRIKQGTVRTRSGSESRSDRGKYGNPAG